LEGIDEETYVYYVHSYAAEVCEATIARTDYGGESARFPRVSAA